MKIFLATIIMALIACDGQRQKLINSENDEIEEVRGRNEQNIQTTEENRLKQIGDLENILMKFPELNTYSLYLDNEPFFIKGDFYGDDIEDIAVLIKDSSEVKLCIINLGNSNTTALLGNGEEYDPKDITDYSWVGEFKTVKKGEVLWSNYESDFRDVEDVPEKEKVILDYDAIFVHQREACGGGFIFWKDGKFNWLQQE